MEIQINGSGDSGGIEDIELNDVDTVIITAATSSNEPIELATKIARNKAKIVVIGDIPLNISRNDFYYKELELVVSKSYGPGRYDKQYEALGNDCLLYTSPSPRDGLLSRMPSSA